MGVFDRADEGSEEAQAYRAEFARENARLGAKAAPAILTIVGIVFLWIAVTAAASYARDSRLPDTPVACGGQVMERGDTCWAILSRGRGDRGEPMFELLARAGVAVDVPAVVMRGGLTEKPYPYDYDRRLTFQRNTRAHLISAMIPGSVGIATLALAVGAMAILTSRRPRAGAAKSANALRRAIVDGAEPLTRSQTRALRSLDTPLLTEDPRDPARVRALFVWRHEAANPPVGVYLWANRLTDKHRVDAGLMRLRPAGDLWFVELTLPRDVLSGYRILPFRADSPGVRDGRPVDGRAIRSAAVPDPLNRSADSSFGSVLRGPDAPDLSPWLGLHDAPSPVLDGTTEGDPAVRYRLFVPPGEGEVELAIVFDADAWIDRHGLPAVVERRRSRGGGPRMCVLGIDSPTGPAERLRFLGSDAVRRAVADEVLPAALALLPGAPRRVLAAGQSMGAIAALALACEHPGRIDTVLAYSPSVWWRPGLTTRPESVLGREQWVHDLLSTPGAPFALHLAVGSYEDELVPNVAAVAATARASGHTVTETVFTGGHDETDWAALLLKDLRPSDHPVDRGSAHEGAPAPSTAATYLWRGFLLACTAGFLVLAARGYADVEVASGPVRCDGRLMERQDTCLLIDHREIGTREDLVRAGEPPRELRAYTRNRVPVLGHPMTYERMEVARAADRRQHLTQTYGFSAVALLLVAGVALSFPAVARPVGHGLSRVVRRLRGGRRGPDRARLDRVFWGGGRPAPSESRRSGGE
ncbi:MULTISPECIES: enterochelin esterase domain-containing protein [Tsukamurella]|uniref:DUF3327 domain-containing protein n=2 Tax=Tsukamurella TaxID=2060 RepID=A0A5C5S1I5_9ACTN|nr:MULTISPECIES: enterochelin esterase domain-containing protein [Tsukamurella]NMD54346.1 DUF3327 domain-containing protein [Tsukamurella columbiensis]TWS28141.1 DUF3327 domain-containing protein [Tsukamurella conjunctivitidis]